MLFYLILFTWSVCGSTVQVQKLAAKEFLGENIPSRILMIFPNTQQDTYCIAVQKVANSLDLWEAFEIKLSNKIYVIYEFYKLARYFSYNVEDCTIVLQSPQYAIYTDPDSTYAFFLAYVRTYLHLTNSLIITVITDSYANFALCICDFFQRTKMRVCQNTRKLIVTLGKKYKDYHCMKISGNKKHFLTFPSCF